MQHGTAFLVKVYDDMDYEISIQDLQNGTWGPTFPLLNYLTHIVPDCLGLTKKLEFMEYIESF